MDDPYTDPLERRLDRIMAAVGSVPAETLRAAIRQEFIDAIREAGDHWWSRVERRTEARQRDEVRAALIAALTEDIEALFQERLALERELGDDKPPAGVGYRTWRLRLVSQLHTNEARYRELKRMRHVILKRLPHD